MVVDPDGRNAALAKRWHLPFRIASDPGGERFLKPLDLWNAEERDGIAVPALLVISPQADEVENLVVDKMVGVVELDVPITVDAKWGKSWSDAH